MQLPRMARQGTICLTATRGQAVQTRSVYIYIYEYTTTIYIYIYIYGYIYIYTSLCVNSAAWHTARPELPALRHKNSDLARTSVLQFISVVVVVVEVVSLLSL